MILNHMRLMARNNAWANERLLEACCSLSDVAFRARRTSFFPSLSLTLNHVLIVDWYYLDALEAGGQGRTVFANLEPFPQVPELRAAQAATDQRLIAYCDGLDEAALARTVTIDRGSKGLTQERVDATLLHLFQHQIHHRGQAHAMLADTHVPPPQLDDFFLVYERDTRAQQILQEGGLAG